MAPEVPPGGWERPVGEHKLNLFSSTKFKILVALRREEKSDIVSLSRRLEMTPMAVYKHIKDLEARGLVLHESRRGGVGRPKLVYSASPESTGLFPTSYSELALTAVRTIRDKLGRSEAEGLVDGVVRRAFSEYGRWTGDGTVGERLERFVRLRDADGYMADVISTERGYELVEHNCPIADIAKEFPGICETEREMLEKLFGSGVDRLCSDPTQVKACRFLLAAPAR